MIRDCGSLPASFWDTGLWDVELRMLEAVLDAGADLGAKEAVQEFGKFHARICLEHTLSARYVVPPAYLVREFDHDLFPGVCLEIDVCVFYHSFSGRNYAHQTTPVQCKISLRVVMSAANEWGSQGNNGYQLIVLDLASEEDLCLWVPRQGLWIGPEAAGMFRVYRPAYPR